MADEIDALRAMLRRVEGALQDHAAYHGPTCSEHDIDDAEEDCEACRIDKAWPTRDEIVALVGYDATGERK